jgi:small subunit ribosomal protein S20
VFVLPNIKSAKKRVKVNEAKNLQNKMQKSALKSVLKKADTAITSNTADKAESLKLATKKLDQAVAKGIIHKNQAANKKSSLTLKFNKTEA